MSRRAAQEQDHPRVLTPTGIVVRVLAVVVIVLAASWIVAALREALDLQLSMSSGPMMDRAILVGTCLYVCLLAIPFVPGVEIGVTLLTFFGASVAPLVYGATVLALMVSFAVGRMIPLHTVVSGLRIMRLERAAVSLEASGTLSHEERVSHMLAGSSPRLLRLATRYRYVAVLLAINTPGNVLIGGGGGIALMAGISGFFAPLPFLLTIAVAVAPVPIAVALLGA